MRDIKYKGWNTEQNIMYSEKELGQDELTIDPDGRGFVNVCSSDKKFSEYYSHILPLQYTSLKDKNEFDIYDGDIIKCTDGADEIDIRDSDTGVGCVEWNYTYGFWSISKIENGLGDILQKGYIEIIGNKYENPELLI